MADSPRIRRVVDETKENNAQNNIAIYSIDIGAGSFISTDEKRAPRCGLAAAPRMERIRKCPVPGRRIKSGVLKITSFYTDAQTAINNS